MPSYRADALVVLGRGVDPDGALPRLAQQRVERAAELFAWETAPRIIFSGRCSLMTDAIPAVTEARAMAEYALSLDLPLDALLVEEESRDTIGNAYFVMRRFLEPNDWMSIRVVTSDFHIQRTAWVFQKVFGLGYDVSFSPAPSELDHSTIAARARARRIGHRDVSHGMARRCPRRRSPRVQLVCQEPYPERYDCIAEAYRYHQNSRVEQLFARDVPYRGKCIMHKPQLGSTLPVYVWDKHDEFPNVVPMINLADDEIESYIERNAGVVQRVVEERGVTAMHANHAVLMSVVAQRVSARTGVHTRSRRAGRVLRAGEGACAQRIEALASGCFPLGTYFGGMKASIDAIAELFPEEIVEAMKLNPFDTVADIARNVSPRCASACDIRMC